MASWSNGARPHYAVANALYNTMRDREVEDDAQRYESANDAQGGDCAGRAGRRIGRAPRPAGGLTICSRPAPPLPPPGEFVIRNATVLTMDPNIGDLGTGDVHVRDGTIIAVEPRIDLTNVQFIEGRGMICMPGFVDTHWHLWTSLFRPFVRADVNELGYFPVSSRLGQLFTPEDSYRSVMLGIAEALSAGVTTVHNWAHNVRIRITPTPSSPPCAMRASVDGLPTVPRRGCRTISRWTWLALRASSATGCRATVCSHSASARATSAP